MHSQRRGIVLLLNLVLMLILILAASTACWGDPSFEIIFENQSQDKLTIYVNNHEVGNVNPGEQITDSRFPITITKFQIEAKNPQGEVIFSETLTREQMQRIESLVYKVVIKPSQSE